MKVAGAAEIQAVRVEAVEKGVVPMVVGMAMMAGKMAETAVELVVVEVAADEATGTSSPHESESGPSTRAATRDTPPGKKPEDVPS